MDKIITMLILCFVPAKDGTLHEAWHVEQNVTVEHCLIMNRTFAGGGPGGVITVRCGRREASR